MSNRQQKSHDLPKLIIRRYLILQIIYYIQIHRPDFILLCDLVSLSPTATHCFPYVKKRIAVMYQHHTDLNPIEVAIDEMSKKVAELRQLCASSEVDMIKLQLKLQGSISVQVHNPATFKLPSV